MSLLLDDAGRVRQARLSIVEFRGFEKFIQGRPFWEVPVLVQRLCGICPVSHLLAASKACDFFVLGAGSVTPTAAKLRRLFALRPGAAVLTRCTFFYLASADLLFGFDDEVAHRNITGVIADHPDIALMGVKLRQYGQEVIRVLTGKRVHGTGSQPGGFNKSLSGAERDALQRGIEEVIAAAGRGVVIARDLFLSGETRAVATSRPRLRFSCRWSRRTELWNSTTEAFASRTGKA